MLPKDVKCDRETLISLTLDEMAIKKHNCLVLYLVLPLVLLVMNLSTCISFKLTLATEWKVCFNVNNQTKILKLV